MTSEKLKGRVALVTGGSRGIGRATALKLAEEGASVSVNYQQQETSAAEVVELITRKGGRAISIRADVGDKSAVAEMVGQTVDLLGTINILVNNAGIARFGELKGYSEEELDLMWRTNVKGVIQCTAAVAPPMIEAGFGRIINLSSIAGLGTSFAGTTFYGSTKAAVLNLSKRFALELGPHGICVNAICPGLIKTEMPFEGRTQEQIDEMIGIFSDRSMLRRTGEPEEIASLICFLASDEASFITGQTLTVDGGRMDYLAH